MHTGVCRNGFWKTPYNLDHNQLQLFCRLSCVPVPCPCLPQNLTTAADKFKTSRWLQPARISSLYPVEGLDDVSKHCIHALVAVHLHSTENPVGRQASHNQAGRQAGRQQARVHCRMVRA